MYQSVRHTLLIVGPLQSNFAQIDLVEVTRCTSLVSCSTEEIVVFVDRVGVFLEQVQRTLNASERFSHGMLVNHGPSQQSSKEEYKPWK